jgi:adenosine kinase
MSILICGSLAFDTIMVFKDQFKNHILPESIHKLSVAFYVPELRKEFGGTAGNIAYNLKLLDESPLQFILTGLIKMGLILSILKKSRLSIQLRHTSQLI